MPCIAYDNLSFSSVTPEASTPRCHACRELTHYKGEPDPFKGDVPNQKVRDSAKEALDAIFAATAVNPPTTPAPHQVHNLDFVHDTVTSVINAIIVRTSG